MSIIKPFAISAMRSIHWHSLLPPTGFNFGIDDNPSKIPLSFGVPFICALPFGGGGRDGAPAFVRALLLPFESAMRPATTGPLLSTVVVFFSFAPFWILNNSADRGSPDPDDLPTMQINFCIEICAHNFLTILPIFFAINIDNVESVTLTKSWSTKF